MPASRAHANICPRVHPTAKIALAIALGMLAGCAAPGPSVPPTENIPAAVTDLAARQVGTSVVLHFTLPQRATDGSPLAGGRRVEIFRRFSSQPPASSSLTPAQTPAAAASLGKPAFTIGPSALAGDLSGNTVTFTDALGAGVVDSRLGQTAVYHVKTAAGRGPWSDASNAAALTLARPPAPVHNLTAAPTPQSVLLRWSSGAPEGASEAQSYVVYRARLAAGGNHASAPSTVGSTTVPSYTDDSIQPGQRYRYTVRAVAKMKTGEVESADSSPVVVQVPVSSRPQPPQGLEAIAVQEPKGSLEVDLSWAISGAGDLAGYNVYRSRQPSGHRVRLNRQLLAAPAFRDVTVAPGVRYRYWVSAVNAAGDQSAPSAPVTVKVPAVGANTH